MYHWFEGQIYSIPLLSPHTKLLGQEGYCDDSDSGVMTHSYDCPPHIKYVKHFIYVWSRSGMSIKWMRGPYHYITVWYMSKIYSLTSKLGQGQGYCDDSGVRTHSYDCPPHKKYVKHLVFVWSGSGVSIQGLGGPNHILQHVPSENPTLNPTTGDWPTPFWSIIV